MVGRWAWCLVGATVVACNSFDDPSGDLPGSPDPGAGIATAAAGAGPFTRGGTGAVGAAGGGADPVGAAGAPPTDAATAPTASPTTPASPGVPADVTPSTTDTDGDGCPDAAVDLLGGCDGDGDAVFFDDCALDGYTAGVTFRVPDLDGGAPSDLSLVSPGLPDITSSYDGADPTAGTVDLTVTLAGLPLDFTGVSLTSLLLVDAAGDLVAEGHLLVVAEGPCRLGIR
jgi:hypothetical protein